MRLNGRVAYNIRYVEVWPDKNKKTSDNLVSRSPNIVKLVKIPWKFYIY